MARPLRLEFPGAVYHITARGNAKQPIVADDRDRSRFVELLATEVQQQHWLCYAWCLMDNHFHLVFETPEANLVAGMRRFNQVYTQAFNRRHGRTGHVYQGRYKSILVEKQSHLLELCRYVPLNPVRAGMAEAAEDWRWSSYRATAGLDPAPGWLHVDWVLENFAPEKEAARSAYRRFVAAGLDAESPWKSLQGQIWLGSEGFRDRMSRLVARQNLKEVPSGQSHPDRPSAEEVLGVVSDAFGIDRGELLDRSHQPAFQAAVYLLRRACNLPLAEVSRIAGVSPSRISRIQANIEHDGGDDDLRLLLERYKIKS